MEKLMQANKLEMDFYELSKFLRLLAYIRNQTWIFWGTLCTANVHSSPHFSSFSRQKNSWKSLTNKGNITYRQHIGEWWLYPRMWTQTQLLPNLRGPGSNSQRKGGVPTAFLRVWIPDPDSRVTSVHPPSYPVFPASWGPPSLQQTFLDFRIHGTAYLCKIDLSNWSQFANSLFCKQGTLKRERQILNYYSISKSLFQQKTTGRIQSIKECSSLWKNLTSTILSWFFSFYHLLEIMSSRTRRSTSPLSFPLRLLLLPSLLSSRSWKMTLKYWKQ